MMVRRLRLGGVCLLLAVVAAGCGGNEAPGSAVQRLAPGAQREIVEALRADLAAERHPSDGGGRGWIEHGAEGSAPVTAGGLGRWTLFYEAGPLGIAENGVLYLQVSPFWGWSTPQVLYPDAPGFTLVSTDAEGVELDAGTLDPQLLGVRIRGLALEPGERIRIEFGAGPNGARADRFAERGARFWFAVDGDGDGIRKMLADSPAVEIRAGPAAMLVLTLPSTARPGEKVRLTAAVLDAAGNAGVGFEGEIRLNSLHPAVGLSTIRIAPDDWGAASVELTAPDEGIVRIEAEGPAGLRGASNPLVILPEGPRVLWGDLHGHSNFSDGTGIPEDYFRYARDVAALDVIALTDHDHWGMQPLALHPELWEEIREQTTRYHEPGRFVTLLGYEWTNWLHGHRHVLYFRDDGEILSAVDPDYETPPQLWDALRGREALTFAHHSAGGPVGTNWDYAPDPELEPVTEVASVHGSSEAPDSPSPIYNPAAGNFVRDVLERGYRLGFVGSGDGHDGHPGLAAIAAPQGGLAAIFSEELTRAGVKAAMEARHVYATNGPRILLLATLGGRPMGSELPVSPSEELEVRVVAPLPLDRVDVVRRGRGVESSPCGGETECRLQRTLTDLTAGDYLYLRAVQVDGGAAWSSPFFVR